MSDPSFSESQPPSRPPVQARTILTIVRHGQTSANIDHVWHGSTDTPLTALGERQAERVATYLAAHKRDATRIYASPLTRARNTAAPIAAKLGLEPTFDADLREFGIGAWEGKSAKELHEVHDLWHHIETNPDYRPHGGESPRQVTLRMTGCLRALCARHPGERLIVVTHGGAVALALGALLSAQKRFSHVMKNCAVTELALEPVPELISFDIDAHL